MVTFSESDAVFMCKRDDTVVAGSSTDEVLTAVVGEAVSVTPTIASGVGEGSAVTGANGGGLTLLSSLLSLLLLDEAEEVEGEDENENPGMLMVDKRLLRFRTRATRLRTLRLRAGGGEESEFEADVVVALLLGVELSVEVEVGLVEAENAWVAIVDGRFLRGTRVLQLRTGGEEGLESEDEVELLLWEVDVVGSPLEAPSEVGLAEVERLADRGREEITRASLGDVDEDEFGSRKS